MNNTRIKSITTHVYFGAAGVTLPPGIYRGVQTGYVVTIPQPGGAGEVQVDPTTGFGTVSRGPCLDIEVSEGIRGTATVTITIGPIGSGTCTITPA